VLFLPRVENTPQLDRSRYEIGVTVHPLESRSPGSGLVLHALVDDTKVDT